MPINLDRLVSPSPKGVMPNKGFSIYMPRFSEKEGNFFDIPESEKEGVINYLENKFLNSGVKEGINAALEDYVYPFQKVIVCIEGSRILVSIEDFEFNEEGEGFLTLKNFS